MSELVSEIMCELDKFQQETIELLANAKKLIEYPENSIEDDHEELVLPW